MTKHLILMAALFMSAAISFAQTKEEKPDTKAFLNRYQNLVMRMEKAAANNNVTRDSIYAWKDERTAIKRLYSDTYKHILSDDELEKYFAISTDYKATRASMDGSAEARSDAPLVVTPTRLQLEAHKLTQDSTSIHQHSFKHYPR